MDWQHGPHSRVTGIDPLWMLNHFHYLDAARGGDRPLLLSRYAGPGSHRYPIGFSGDVELSWDSLEFQPEFTATASNIGYGWWSHDIGGHMFGRRDDELTARWVQLGVYSPILRLHSTDNPFLAKEPWAFPAETRAALGEALRLRVRLVPYLHAMNHRAAIRGHPPRAPALLRVAGAARGVLGAQPVPLRQRTARGADHLAARPVTLLGSVTAWLPPGVWTDIHTGVVLQGERTIELHRGPDSIPVLLRSGGILPLAGEDETDAAANPAQFELVVAPGADGSFTLVEDDGTDGGAVVRTTIRWNQERGELVDRARRRPGRRRAGGAHVDGHVPRTRCGRGRRRRGVARAARR